MDSVVHPAEERLRSWSAAAVFHAETLLLFTISDIKTIFLPVVCLLHPFSDSPTY